MLRSKQYHANSAELRLSHISYAVSIWLYDSLTSGTEALRTVRTTTPGSYCYELCWYSLSNSHDRIQTYYDYRFSLELYIYFWTCPTPTVFCIDCLFRYAPTRRKPFVSKSGIRTNIKTAKYGIRNKTTG